jgi:hypothetical protein
LAHPCASAFHADDEIIRHRIQRQLDRFCDEIGRLYHSRARGRFHQMAVDRMLLDAAPRITSARALDARSTSPIWH